MYLSIPAMAGNSTRSPPAASSSTPFIARVLSTVTSKRGFEGEVDVIGASVDAAEELRLAERARAVRHAEAEVGFLRDAHVEARIEVAEQLPVAAVAAPLVLQFHLRDLLRIGKAGADAQARVHPAVPAEAVPVRLEERHPRPEIVLVGLFEMALDADEAGEVDRPAARALDELAAEVQRRDVGVVDRVALGAVEPRDLQHVAVARVAVERLDDQRLRAGIQCGPPALLLGREVVEEAEKRLAVQAALRQRAAADLARAARGVEPADQVPALGERVARVERGLKIQPGAGVVIAGAVVEVVQLGIAPRQHELRAHGQPAAAPIVGPVARAQLHTLRGMARIAQHFDVRRAPTHVPAQARAGIETGLARREAERAGRLPVAREALEPVAQEDVDAPVLLLELEAKAGAMQIGALAFVEVEGQLVRAALGAAGGRALVAQEVPDRRTATGRTSISGPLDAEALLANS